MQALGVEKTLRQGTADAGSWMFNWANLHLSEDKGIWDGMSGASAAVL